MFKNVFIFEAANTIEMDRWYFRYHSKECIRFFGPWMRRYETYRAYDAPPEADRFSVRRGRMTELWYTSVEEFIEAKPNNRPYTPFRPSPSTSTTGRRPRRTASIMVPAMPTEDFLGKEPTPEQTTLLRWIQFIRYPEGIPVEEAEQWYLEVHSQETQKQPGLLRHVSHRVLDNAPVPSAFYRMTELWYESFDAWQEAVIDSPPAYTPPRWHSDGHRDLDMVSTFVPYKPDVDFLKDTPLIP